MSNKLASIFALLSASTPKLNINGSYGTTRIEDIDFTKKKAPLPKGCKEYYFNTLGDFLNYNDGVWCYKCIASSDRVAIDKFNKWRDKQ